MGGVKRIPQMAKVSTVNVRLQPWAQQLEETSKPPRSASQSTNSSETVPPPASQNARKIPDQSYQKGRQALAEQTSQPPAPISTIAIKSSSKAAKASMREPTEQEVLTAVESLYDDELKPYGRLLRKRFIEHREAAGGKSEDVDLGHIRVVCESSTRLSMESEAGGEWSTLLCDRDPVFVDFYGVEDPFPQALWSEIAAYFAQLNGEEGLLPGGRYACAQALVQRRVTCIRGMSLGQVCHLVQLALGHRKILGYNNGAIAPYRQSQSHVKDSAAAQQSSCISTAGSHDASELRIATWETARDCLRQILDGAAASGRDYVPLSNIKRVFRSRFSLELSETTFGHARLSDLLQAAAFQDICTVQLLDRGYVVFPAPQAPSNEIEAQVTANDRGPMEPVERSPFPALQAEEGNVPQLLSPTLTASPSMSPAPYHVEALRCQANQWRCSNGYGMQDADAAGFSDLSACLIGQLLGSPWASNDLYSGIDSALTENSPLEVETPMTIEPHARVKFCPNEPLCLEEEDAPEAANPSNVCKGLAQKRPTLTPSTLRKSGFVVQNTFINPVSVPPTPIPGAMRRSSSMPCINHALDEGELEVPEVSSSCFSFPCESWSLKASAISDVVTSPACTASPAWSPQPRHGQLNLSGAAPCASLVVRISDFL